MVADTYTPRLGLIEQGTGNNNNSWGNTFNTSFALIADRAIAGVNIINATGGTVDLSGSPPPAGARQDVDAIQLANGALTSDLTVIVPQLSKLWWFHNATSGNFNMFVKVPNGTSANGGLIQIPQGRGIMVMADGAGSLVRHDRDQIGSFQLSGKASAGPGELACNGASLLKASFPDLFNAIGTIWGSADSLHFTLPNFTDTGRFLRSSSGTLTVGTYQANQNLAHTHAGASFSGTTSNENADHSHTGSGTTSTDSPDHAHGYNAPASGVGTGTSPNYFDSSAAAATTSGANQRHTHTYNFTTGGISNVHQHTYSGTTGTIPSSGGTEARPEAAVVLMCIRY